MVEGISTVDSNRAMRWIGAILGAIVGAILGYILGEKGGKLTQAIAWAAVGLPAGALLGMVLIYVLGALLVLVVIPLSFVALFLYVVVLAIADFIRRE